VTIAIDEGVSTVPFASVWSKRLCVVIAIGGGVSGIITSIADASGPISLLGRAIWFGFICLYAMGILIGIRIVEGDVGGASTFRKYLWLQVPLIQSNFFSYFFSAVGSITIFYRGGFVFDFAWVLGGAWTFSLFTVQPQSGIGINVVPVILILLLKVLSPRV
jgi:hypothetical protein